jgi:hypothetical protein
MSAVYELIGRFVVRAAWFRFGRQIKVAGAVTAVVLVAGGFLALRRQPPEG